MNDKPLDKLCSHVNAKFVRGDYTYQSPVDIASVKELSHILCSLYVMDDRQGAEYRIWLTEATTGEPVAEFSVYLLNQMHGRVNVVAHAIERSIRAAYDTVFFRTMPCAEHVQPVEWEDLL